MCLIQYVSTVDFLDHFEEEMTSSPAESPQLRDDKGYMRKFFIIKEKMDDYVKQIETLVSEIHEEFGDGCLIYKV